MSDELTPQEQLVKAAYDRQTQLDSAPASSLTHALRTMTVKWRKRADEVEPRRGIPQFQRDAIEWRTLKRCADELDALLRQAEKHHYEEQATDWKLCRICGENADSTAHFTIADVETKSQSEGTEPAPTEPDAMQQEIEDVHWRLR